MRPTGSVEQPIELLFGLTYQPIDPIKLLLMATLECDAATHYLRRNIAL